MKPEDNTSTLTFTCTKCGEVKPISEKVDGSTWRCKPCRKATRRAWYEANAEKARAYTAQWRKDNPERAAAAVKDWHEKHSEQQKEYRRQHYTKNIEKRKEYRRKQYASDPEAAKRSVRDWVEANRERARDRDRKHREDNRELYRARTNAYNAANRDAYRAVRRNRKARQRGAEGKFTKNDVVALAEKQRDKCATCKCKLNGDYHIDHIVPLIRGGTNWPDNLQLLCPKCNMRKGAKDPYEWAQQNGCLF
jgi:5-methylcytosine-specific restriction endonuclease McrA